MSLNKQFELKVIHFVSSLSRGGKERQLATIYQHNKPIKQEIIILYFNESSPSYFEEYEINPDNHIRVKARSFRSRLLQTYKVLQREKPDVVFAWGLLESTIGLLLNPLLDFKFINGSVRHGILSRKLSHYFRMVLLHLSRNIVSNSFAGLKVNYLNRGRVLYNGIDEKFFNVSIKDKYLLELKLENKSNILISVANLVPYKDYFSVLNALALLKQKGIPFHYLIIGEGPTRGEIYSMIHSMGLNNQVTLVGTIDNVEEYLAISDVFIHSSKGEGCSNAILEAMSAGLPIIASHVGGVPEIIAEEYGILFCYQNVNELSSAIEELIASPLKIKKMGNAAKTKAEKSFTTEIMMCNYYNIIDEIL